MAQNTSESGKRYNRRSFLQKMGVAGAIGAGASVLAACGEGGGGTTQGTFTCTDTTGLAQPAIQMRQSLGYVDQSVSPEQWCHNCAFFQAPAEGTQCGGCTLIQGPIHPDGWCRSWAAKPVEGA